MRGITTISLFTTGFAFLCGLCGTSMRARLPEIWQFLDDTGLLDLMFWGPLFIPIIAAGMWCLLARKKFVTTAVTLLASFLVGVVGVLGFQYQVFISNFRDDFERHKAMAGAYSGQSAEIIRAMRLGSVALTENK